LDKEILVGAQGVPWTTVSKIEVVPPDIEDLALLTDKSLKNRDGPDRGTFCGTLVELCWDT
jgi:hypothetical protein